jgi:predicted pyridoxine 5'-phosphate oxidase superfamily flavin-nucleotide-binding protein
LICSSAWTILSFGAVMGGYEDVDQHHVAYRLFFVAAGIMGAFFDIATYGFREIDRGLGEARVAGPERGDIRCAPPGEPVTAGPVPGSQSMCAARGVEVQARLRAREDAERVGRIIVSEIFLTVGFLFRNQRMAVAASLDGQARPWVSLLTNPPGFIQAVDDHLLRLAVAPPPDDPLTANLRAHPELKLLVIDPRTKRHLRFNGRNLLSSDGLFLLASEVYGNCPKYIQKRRLVGEREGAGEVRRSPSLDKRTRALVVGADTFFIASWHPKKNADASHRKNRPGFVRVLDETTLEFPDYPSNNMFNTLGNLIGHPRAKLLFVDFERNDLLQLTGRAQILWKPDTAVRVAIEEVRETPRGSSCASSWSSPARESPRGHAEGLGISGRNADHEAP